MKKEFEQAVRESLENVFYEFNGKKGCSFDEFDLQEAVSKFIGSGFFNDDDFEDEEEYPEDEEEQEEETQLYAGVTYYNRACWDYNLICEANVSKRTAKAVTVIDGGKKRRCKIHVSNGQEYICFDGVIFRASYTKRPATDYD